jgi:hypothetical protein
MAAMEFTSVRLGAGRLFGIFYLAAWVAALAGLVYFAPLLPRYLSIPAGVALLFLAPDVETIKRLLSGKEDAGADNSKIE